MNGAQSPDVAQTPDLVGQQLFCEKRVAALEKSLELDRLDLKEAAGQPGAPGSELLRMLEKHLHAMRTQVFLKERREARPARRDLRQLGMARLEVGTGPVEGADSEALDAADEDVVAPVGQFLHALGVGDRPDGVEGRLGTDLGLHLATIPDHHDPEVGAFSDQQAIAFFENVERQDAARKKDCVKRKEWQELGHGN